MFALHCVVCIQLSNYFSLLTTFLVKMSGIYMMRVFGGRAAGLSRHFGECMKGVSLRVRLSLDGCLAAKGTKKTAS